MYLFLFFFFFFFFVFSFVFFFFFFFFSSRRRHTRLTCDWSSDVCSSDLAHETDRLGGRADEGDAAGPADLRERRVLGEKAVAWVDRLAVGDGSSGDRKSVV